MSKRNPAPPEGALYVRLPGTAVDKLDRAAEALGIHKKDLIAGLVSKYVDPDSRKGLTALGALAAPRRVIVDRDSTAPTMGSVSFQAYDAAEQILEVMTLAQAAQLLQIDAKQLLALADAGKVPGRKLGADWRFSRAALVAWVAGDKA